MNAKAKNNTFHNEIVHDQLQKNKVPNLTIIHGTNKIGKSWVFSNSFCLVFLFVFCGIYLNTCSEMTSKQKQIEKLTMQIREIKSSAASLKSIMSDDIYLEDIEKKATESLGLTKALEYQIKFIELPKQSHVEYMH